MGKFLSILILFIVGCASTPKIEWLNLEMDLKKSPNTYPHLLGDSLEIDSLKNKTIQIGLQENGNIVWKVKEEK